MEPAAVGRAARRRRKASPPGDLDTSGAAQAPVSSVHAPADLGQERATPAAADPLTSSNVVVVGSFFFLGVVLYAVWWFATMFALQAVYLPWSITAAQHLIGCGLVVVLWVVQARPVPRLTLANMKVIFPIAVCHTFSNVCFAVGLGDKHSCQFDECYANFVLADLVYMASRPLFTAFFSTIFLKHAVSRWMCSTLVLFMASSAAMMTTKDWEFHDKHWFTIGGVIGFNLAVSVGTVFAKRSMGTIDTGDNMSPANLYAVVTIMSSMMFLPLCIIMEGSKIEHLCLWWATKLDGGGWLIVLILLSGFCFFLYNEVSFRCLGLVRPLTHTVGRTFEFAGATIALLILFANDDVTITTVVIMSFAAAAIVWMYVLAGTIEALLCRQKEKKA